jgi:hypothetical protein
LEATQARRRVRALAAEAQKIAAAASGELSWLTRTQLQAIVKARYPKAHVHISHFGNALHAGTWAALVEWCQEKDDYVIHLPNEQI